MEKHPIESLMGTSMESIREMVDVNTVVGEAVQTQDGSTIIPISKVSFGFVAGGGEYTVEDSKNRTVATEVFPFAGGSGAGVSVQPVGFLVVGEGTVKVLPAQTSGAMERVVELLPQLLEDFAQNGEKNAQKPKKVFKTEIETFDYTEDDTQS